MLRHDLVVAFRRLRHDKLHSAIGVVVLALGVACFLAAYVFVSYLRGYDAQFANADRTYLLYQEISRPGGLSGGWSPGSGRPVAEQLRIDVPELPAVARLRFAYGASAVVDGHESPRRVAFAEPQLLEIFDFKAVAGDLAAALAAPRSAILTEKAALALFGTRDVIGKSLTLKSQGAADVTIAGVMADLPPTSHLSDGLYGRGFEALASWDVEQAIGTTPLDDIWLNPFVSTYVLLPADGRFTLGALDARLADLVSHRVPDYGGMVMSLEARPITSIASARLQAQFEGYYGSVWRFDVLRSLLAFAAGILVLACLNFVNLSTAQSLGRARQIGTRKAVGAATWQVLRQELVHTALLVALAIAVALAAVAPAGRLLQGQWRTAVAVPWAEPRLWLALGGLLVALTALSGAYPALLLARVRPLAALRLGSIQAGPKAVRALLVGAQFAAASLFLIVVAVAIAQASHTRAALLDRYEDPYVSLGSLASTPPLPVDPDVLTAELMRSPGIKGVTGTSSTPFAPPGGFATSSFTRVAGETQGAKLAQEIVGNEYFSVMKVPLLAGRTFARDRAGDLMPYTAEQSKAATGTPHVVLDREAALSLGWSDPAGAIGQMLFRPGESKGALEIIGVVESMPQSVRASNDRGIVYIFNPQYAPWFVVRLAKTDVERSLAGVDRSIAALLPNHPRVAHTFFDEAFEDVYWTFTLIDRVLVGLTLFAVAIAAIGLFGMAIYLTDRRTREIGVRKTQGATPARIARLLLWDFSKPVIVANVVAWPIALYAVERYLGLFAQRIAVTPLPFALALGATLALAWLAVGARVLRAAAIMPMDALREQ